MLPVVLSREKYIKAVLLIRLNEEITFCHRLSISLGGTGELLLNLAIAQGKRAQIRYPSPCPPSSTPTRYSETPLFGGNIPIAVTAADMPSTSSVAICMGSPGW